jgi:eukaryotic-like serine/threonine-protein kinase
MVLSSGARLGSYEIVAVLGVGGMGEVYRARDSKLGREVALKVLPAALADDPERMARFRHEAHVLASLNHPHIAGIYGFEENAIVMELVEGRTLEDRIRTGAIPPDEALSIARQIAEALEAAHEKGVIHRDLKPANIKITPQGLVKVLDFGLAKPENRVLAVDPENSPTMTLSRTEAGVILGTAAYMSPEQAEGKRLDGRSDIFSFGTVLYEMITGRRPFTGESTVSILAAVLRENPRPVRELSAAAPAGLARLIHRCLAKQPDKRWQSVTDIKLLLQDLEHDDSSAAPESAPIRTKRALSLRFAIPFGLAAIFAGAMLSRLFVPASKTTAAFVPPTYTVLTSDSGLSFEPAISPDGKLLAYASDRAGEGSLDIWVRQIPNGHPVWVTTGKADDREPDFSPDGSKIVFRSDRSGGGLYVISPLGGDARKIADRGRQPRFSPDGKWIAYWIGERHGALLGTVWIVPSAGGEPKEITSTGRSGEDPVWAADSKGVVVVGRMGLGPIDAADWVGWLYLPIDVSEARKIVSQTELRGLGLSAPPQQSFIRPAVLADGSILFSARSGGTSTLWTLPVSTSTWRVTGPPVPLTSGPGFHLQPSVATGISPRRYVFSTLSLRSSIASVPATAATDNPPQRWTEGLDLNTHPSVSRDGTKLAFISNRSGNPDVWLKNLRTGRESALTETPWGESYSGSRRMVHRSCLWFRKGPAGKGASL